MTNKFSVIIPTIWKSKCIKSLINTLSNSEVVGEIILVDNDVFNCKIPNVENISKLRYFPMKENIYVNAWNLGVRESRFDNILLCNDDSIINESLLKYLSKIDYSTVGIIGMSWKSYKYPTKKYKLEETKIRN